MRRPKSLLIGLIVVALVAAITDGFREWRTMRERASRPPAATGAAITGHARVVDGDSLEIGGQRVRLFGIDAPELHQDCSTASAAPTPAGRRRTARSKTRSAAPR